MKPTEVKIELEERCKNIGRMQLIWVNINNINRTQNGISWDFDFRSIKISGLNAMYTARPHDAVQINLTPLFRKEWKT